MKRLPRYPAEGRAIFVASMGVEIVDLGVLTGDTFEQLDALVGTRQVRRVEATVYVLTKPLRVT